MNPILKNGKTAATYFGCWLIMAIVMYLMLFNLLLVNKLYLISDLIFQMFLFGGMLLGFWFPVSYMNFETQGKFAVILNYLLIFVVMTSIWIFGCNVFLRLFFGENSDFRTYQVQLLPFRLFFSFFGFLVFVISVNFYKYYQSYIEKKEIEGRLYQSIKEAELTLLRNQMNPHFIFNSLNSISSLTIIDPNKAHEMVVKLSDFLRYTVSYGQMQKVALARELEMCEAYLAIEKIRFGDKIIVVLDVDEATLSHEIPSMLLQTLFENAIKHGVYNSIEQERIHFKAEIIDARLNLRLENTFDATENLSKKGTQTGLKNVRERLKLIYDTMAILTTKTENNLFVVNINLPIVV